MGRILFLVRNSAAPSAEVTFFQAQTMYRVCLRCSLALAELPDGIEVLPLTSGETAHGYSLIAEHLLDHIWAYCLAIC